MSLRIERTARRWALAWLLALACLGAAAQTFTGALSGSWWDPARSGEGFFIEFETAGPRNVAYVAYFTYGPAGAPTWLVGSADYTPGTPSVRIPVATGRGARFGAAFRSTDVVVAPAGVITLEYVSCTLLRARYEGEASFTLILSRLVGPLEGVRCASPHTPVSAVDQALRPLLARAGQTGLALSARRIPSPGEPLAQLGRLLFFSKALSGELDTACASCHHPALGGADGLALSIGADASRPEVLGPGRTRTGGGFGTERGANTFFNAALLDVGHFWDSRVESLGRAANANGAGGGIRTPESAPGTADPLAGPNLPSAQARFPVVGEGEMRGPRAFAGLSPNQVRERIAARLGNYGEGAGELAPSQWLARFRAAFGAPAASAETLITFDNIARAIAEYERSATFVDTPWARYVRGDDTAIGEDAKEGALFFFRTVAEGGLQCWQCHRGDTFTDERHHAVGFPQIGPGATGSGDTGRERATGLAQDRFLYRTPSLLNVELTAPYTHSGAYPDFWSLTAHYVSPDEIVGNFVALYARNHAEACAGPQASADVACAASPAQVELSSRLALDRMKAERRANPGEAMPEVTGLDFHRVLVPMAAFLRTLTDPCLRDRACYGRWIPAPEEAPDMHQLQAVDAKGAPL